MNTKEETELIKKINKRNTDRMYLLGIDEWGVKYFLRTPSWDCGWYWGFGYIHTKDSHEHWDSSIVGKHSYYDTDKMCSRESGDYIHHINENKKFIHTTLTDRESWTLSELMKTFYTLKKTAELYHTGGSHITTNPAIDKIPHLETFINEIELPKVFKAIHELFTTPENKKG